MGVVFEPERSSDNWPAPLMSFCLCFRAAEALTIMDTTELPTDDGPAAGGLAPLLVLGVDWSDEAEVDVSEAVEQIDDSEFWRDLWLTTIGPDSLACCSPAGLLMPIESPNCVAARLSAPAPLELLLLLL